MSKYAVVKIGASQEKVSIGDELVVSSSFSETTLIPILVSPKKGELVSDNKELKKFKVEIQDVGIGKSKKINIFQYKNKTGNRRRMGYREDNKIIKIKNIVGLEGSEEE
ncbi:bL21 family ribosomal protein [Acidimicrobiaceae bacterium]|nr:bL21 family ribosomal protein [Acidimicrobiaceae bacterium]